MVALAYTDAYADTFADVTPVQRAVPAPNRQDHRIVGDPLIDAATRLLSVPVRHAYALLWRAGVLMVDC